ncbi:hypothetical protein ACLNGM_10205 [Aureimonas phyllosphaerae]|uniref:hypothetical protein n=1 Tax=Aureimonas phyllosphaerae TaxID=1166078 RepID=UPI003A5C03AF
MTTVDPREFLLDQFPRKHWPLIPTTLKAAYSAADAMIKEQPILQVQSAADNRGRVVTWATDRAFEQLVKSGRLPFECRWKPFAKPTGSYLEIQLSHSVLSISQVAIREKQPRSVRFRENGRLNNQPMFDLPEFEEEERVKGLPHLLLVHGHRSLDFAHLAVPHPQHHRDYRFRSDNLLHLVHEVPTVGPDVEDTEFEFTATDLLKQDIEKWQRDNGS